jgi:hypothetical protein
MASEQKSCFVIAPIGEDGSEVRQRSDWVLESIIRPAVEPLGYRPIRGDQISEPGDVMRQVVERVVNDPLVVADLTGSNPNVLYELALRHATGKRPILLIRRGEKPPYDIYGERRIEFVYGPEADPEPVIAALRLQVAALESAPVPLQDRDFDVLANLTHILWPERSHGPSAAFLKGLLGMVKKVKNAPSDTDRERQLKALEEALKAAVPRFDTTRVPGLSLPERRPGPRRQPGK